VEEELSFRRQSAFAMLDRRTRQIQESFPEIIKLRNQAAALGASMGKALLSGDEVLYDELNQEMVECGSRACNELVSAGFHPDYLAPPFMCAKCSDKGYAGAEGHPCECRKAILNRLAYEWLSNISNVVECSFDNFELSYYDGDNITYMEKLLLSCKRYAANFTLQSPNLLFIGPPGLGKTHLSLAIAREVVNNGRLVLYASAVQLMERLVDISFSNLQDEYKDIAYGCDLLIMDDLGTEFQTRFTKAEVYNIINTRQIEGRPTIINTNLSLQELEKAYDQRVVSRLVGHYVSNPFVGKDIRYQKRVEKIQPNARKE